MGLSSELASQFAKVTNDSSRNTNGTKLYGTITMLGEVPHVKLDGTEELTPISRTVEVAEDDRVEVIIANHSATVTGNLTDPSIGVVRAGNLESKITQTAEQIQLQVSDLEKNLDSKITQTATSIQTDVSDLEKNLDSKITQTATEIRSEVSDEVANLDSKITQTATSIQTDVSAKFETVDGEIEKFSTFKQTVEGFSFMGNGGTVKINGGDINLTGAISFSDLSDATTKQQEIDSIAATANTASTNASTALTNASNAWNRAGTALNKANEAYGVATSITIPDYIKGTYIDSTTIKSPNIEGNNIKVYGTFQTIGHDGASQVTTGYMGAAMGKDGYGNDTIGVALSNSWNSSNGTIGTNYVIVTNAGARMQSGNNRVIVTDEGIYINTTGSYKAYYNGKEIGSGSASTVTAVWG